MSGRVQETALFSYRQRSAFSDPYAESAYPVYQSSPRAYFQSGSIAPQLDDPYEVFVEENQKPHFEVLSGSGLDAAARRGVSARFVQMAKLAALLICTLCLLSCVRVALTTLTVGSLSNSAKLSAKLVQKQELVNDLKVQRSVLSSATRVITIATENYGMERASHVEDLALTTPAQKNVFISKSGDSSYRRSLVCMYGLGIDG